MNTTKFNKLPLQTTCWYLASVCMIWHEQLMPAYRMTGIPLRRSVAALASIAAANTGKEQSPTIQPQPAWILGIDTSWHGIHYKLLPNASPHDYFVMTKCHKQYNKTHHDGICLNRITRLPAERDTLWYRLINMLQGYKKISDVEACRLIPDESALEQERNERADSIKTLLRQWYGGNTWIRIEHDVVQESTSILGDIIPLKSNMTQLTMKLLSDLQGNILCRGSAPSLPERSIVEHEIKQAESTSRIIVEGAMSPRDVMNAMTIITWARITRCMNPQRDILSRDTSAFLHMIHLEKLWIRMNMCGINCTLIFSKWPQQFVVDKDDIITIISHSEDQARGRELEEQDCQSRSLTRQIVQSNADSVLNNDNEIMRQAREINKKYSEKL